MPIWPGKAKWYNRTAMARFERHVFVCQNERKADDPRGSCTSRGAAEHVRGDEDAPVVRGDDEPELLRRRMELIRPQRDEDQGRGHRRGPEEIDVAGEHAASRRGV